jgi:predicted PhzF superfamily epimerase YddE/YHI9
MNFPIRKLEKTDITERIKKATGLRPKEAYSCRDLYLVLDSEEQVRDYKPDYNALLSLSEWMGVAITAEGNNSDFVSRFFMPEIIKEDPVTGSTHSCLIPYWAEKLNKKKMTARQLSERGGTLQCELLSDRVKISGNAVLFMKGEISI